MYPIFKGLCVEGHGKTTTSTLALLNQSTWVMLFWWIAQIIIHYINDNESEYTVIEADEYDRSF